MHRTKLNALNETKHQSKYQKYVNLPRMQETGECLDSYGHFLYNLHVHFCVDKTWFVVYTL